MPVELTAPVALIAPLPTSVELHHAPASVLRIVTIAMILATVSIVMLSRPGGTLADGALVTITGP